MPEQVFPEISATEASLSYKLDGVDFLTYDVYVTASKGFQDLPALKEPQTMNWAGSHGTVVDLSAPRYENREIELDCFIKASGKLDFYTKVRAFLQAFQKPELRKLELWLASKPLIYMVYMIDPVNIEKQWHENEMFGTFTLKLIDPLPIKRLLKRTGSVSLMTFKSANPIDIYWGDGTKNLSKFGNLVSITHTYPSSGNYYILVAGVIEEIEDFETDAAWIWTKY